VSTNPWEKELTKVSRYDWLSAVLLQPIHGRKPGVMRVANTVMQHTNDDLGIALCSQERMANWCGVSSTSKVRQHISALEKQHGKVPGSPLARIKKSDLSESELEKLKALGVKKSGRSVLYRINFMWAYEFFEHYSFQLANGVAEPDALAKYWAENSNKQRFEKRTESVRNDHTESVLYKPHQVSAPNTIGDTVGTLEEGLGRKDSVEDSACGNRESDSFIEKYIQEEMKKGNFGTEDINRALYKAQRHDWGKKEAEYQIEQLRRLRDAAA